MNPLEPTPRGHYPTVAAIAACELHDSDLQGTVSDSNPTESPATLTEHDRNILLQCEAVLHRGLATFFDVGEALLTIRSNRLYRVTHSSFESYCHERWGIGRSYAWRVIGAAERLKLLPATETVQRPANEFQMRPFLKLEPKAFPKAWEEVTKRAKHGNVTPTLIQTVVDEVSNRNTTVIRKPSRRKASTNSRLGELLVLINDVRRKLGKREIDSAVEVLERIEFLLFSSSPNVFGSSPNANGGQKQF